MPWGDNKDCCCGCTLRNGCKYFGWYMIVTGVLVLIGLIPVTLPGESDNEEYPIFGMVLLGLIGILRVVDAVLILMGISKGQSGLIKKAICLLWLIAIGEIFLIVEFIFFIYMISILKSFQKTLD